MGSTVFKFIDESGENRTVALKFFFPVSMKSNQSSIFQMVIFQAIMVNSIMISRAIVQETM